jgi:transposase
LERRRMQAFALLRRNIHQAEVARLVGVHRQSVSRWAKEIEQTGRAGLKKPAGLVESRGRPKPNSNGLSEISNGARRPLGTKRIYGLWGVWPI